MGTTYNTAVPAYIVDSTLADGEAWVACATHTETGSTTTDITLSSSTGANNWSQYQDLVLVLYSRTNLAGSAQSTPQLYYNGNTTDTDYTRQVMRTSGSSTSAYTQNNSYIYTCPGVLGLTNCFGSSITRIFDINAAYWKVMNFQVACCDNQTSEGSFMGSMVMHSLDGQNTELQKPITSITFHINNGWASGSRFDIFGVLPRMVNV